MVEAELTEQEPQGHPSTGGGLPSHEKHSWHRSATFGPVLQFHWEGKVCIESAVHSCRTRTSWSRQQLAASSLQLGTSISRQRIALTLLFTSSMTCNPAQAQPGTVQVSYSLAFWECLMSQYFVNSKYLENIVWLLCFFYQWVSPGTECHQ